MKQLTANKKNRSRLFIGLTLLTISLIGLATLVRMIANLTPASLVEAAEISPLGQTGNWNLIFSDEFNEASLNTTKWEPSWFTGNKISPPINDLEDGCYDPAQVSVANGMLHLSAVTTSKPECKDKSGKQAQYASGLVNTRNSFTFAYGYMEARMYLPGSNGQIANWPAFWSNGTGDWPKTGEIDVMEGLSSHKPCWHYHYEDASGTHKGPGGCATDMDGTGWHTYAAKWEPNKITYYYDGVEVGSVSEGVVSAKHFLILNYGINSNYGITVPETVMVDYVRVWEKGTQTSPTPQPSATSTPIPTIIPSSTPVPTPIPTLLPTPTPSPTPAPTPATEIPKGISVKSFIVSPSNDITSRERVRAVAVVQSSERVKVQALTVAVRDSNNKNYDFRGAKNSVRIDSKGFTFRPTARTFPPGEYTAFVAYKMNNKWYNLSPQISFTVSP